MDSTPPVNKALELEPVEISTPAGDEPRPVVDEPAAKVVAQRDLRMTTADEFLAAAAKEYETGKIDRTLWRQAADQHGSDASLVIAAYLRARATALQPRRKPDERSSPSRAGVSRGLASDRNVDPEPIAEVVATAFPGNLLRGVRPKALYSGGAVAALASIAAVVYMMTSPGESKSIRPEIASVAATSANRPAAPTPPKSEQPLVRTSNRAGTNEGGPNTLAATVRQLKIDGNWNVLVLYANEWTRKEPDNAAAWRELSVGYANLQQFNDALDAATKAVQLAPEDALPWRNLGQINLTVDRLPEAAAAFGRALAVNPDDLDARCGAALVAQRQARPKDPNAVTRRVGPADGGCPELSYADTTVASAGSAARKPVSPVGR